MLDQLIASRRTRGRSRMLASGILSVGAHATMIAAIIGANVDRVDHSRTIPVEPIILFPEPAPDRGSPPQLPPGLPLPRRAMEGAVPDIPFPTIVIDLPVVGAVPAFDPRMYSSRGAAPGSPGAPRSDTTSPELGAAFAYQAVDERPEPLTCPTPAYPPMLRMAGVEGDVLVELVIGGDGRVEPETIVILERSHEAFARAVIDMYHDPRCLFRPGRMAGQAVRVLVRQTTAFRIR